MLFYEVKLLSRYLKKNKKTHEFPSPPLSNLLLPSLSFLCIFFHFFLEVHSYVSQFFSPAFFFWPCILQLLSLSYTNYG